MKARIGLMPCVLGSVAGCRTRSDITSAPGRMAGYEYAIAMPDCAPWDAMEPGDPSAAWFIDRLAPAP